MMILAIIRAKNPDGSPIDLNQLIERLPYTTTKQSIQFSIRALGERGLVGKDGFENRRERRRRLLVVTPLGEHWANLLGVRPVPLTLEEAMDVDEIARMEEAIGLNDPIVHP